MNCQLRKMPTVSRVPHSHFANLMCGYKVDDSLRHYSNKNDETMPEHAISNTENSKQVMNNAEIKLLQEQLDEARQSMKKAVRINF